MKLLVIAVRVKRRLRPLAVRPACQAAPMRPGALQRLRDRCRSLLPPAQQRPQRVSAR